MLLFVHLKIDPPYEVGNAVIMDVYRYNPDTKPPSLEERVIDNMRGIIVVPQDCPCVRFGQSQKARWTLPFTFDGKKMVGCIVRGEK